MSGRYYEARLAKSLHFRAPPSASFDAMKMSFWDLTDSAIDTMIKIINDKNYLIGYSDKNYLDR